MSEEFSLNSLIIVKNVNSEEYSKCYLLCMKNIL